MIENPNMSKNAAEQRNLFDFAKAHAPCYVPSLPLKNTKRSPLWTPFSLEICDSPCIYCV